MDLVVKGMTCGGCVKSVERAVGRVAGVSAVTVELDGGKVEVQGEATRDAVVTAIVKAGYEVAPA